MSDYREYNAAERRMEKLVEIAVAVNHPDLLTVTTDEARLITASRMGMAHLLLRLALLLATGARPGAKKS